MEQGYMDGAMSVSIIPLSDGRWVERHPEGYLLCAVVVRDGELTVRRQHMSWLDVYDCAVAPAAARAA